MSGDDTEIKAALFDFGGVILSSPFEAFARYEAEHGLPDGFLRSVNATNPDTNANTNPDTNTNTNPDTNTNANTNANSDTNSDTNPNSLNGHSAMISSMS